MDEGAGNSYFYIYSCCCNIVDSTLDAKGNANSYFIFQGYKIQAWRWEDNDVTNIEHKLVSVPPNLLDPLTELTSIIGGLEKFTEYNISVLCFTEPGDGPRSEFVLVRTKEDSK